MNNDFENRRFFFIKKYLVPTKYYLMLWARHLKCIPYKLYKKINRLKNLFKKKLIQLKGLLSKHLQNSQINLLKNFILKKSFYEHTQKEKKLATQYRVACILDEFSYKCFEPELDLIKLKCKKFITQIRNQPIDFLFVESAWQGNDGQWRVGDYKFFYRLLTLTNYCKKNAIPTVFWSKEDPFHFNYFIEVAKLFDYVFTTDQNMVNQYIKLCGHTDVYVSEFAMQPKMHNPIKTYEREEKICFSGTYYQHRYPERKKFLDAIFAITAKNNKLVIYDRNYTKNIKNLQFPLTYQQFVKGHLPYNEIDKAYKGYIAAINVNTITDSPTMMARRVYELIGCYTPVISNYSLSVARNFSEIVFLFDPDQSEELQQESINSLLFNNDISERMQKGLRNVLSQHTYQHRTHSILEKLKLPYEKSSLKVLVITLIDNLDSLESIRKQFSDQTYTDKRLIVFSHQLKNTDLYPAEKLSALLEEEDFDFLVYFDANSRYGKFYIEDFCHTLKYMEMDIITKALEASDQFTYGEGSIDWRQSMIHKNVLSSSNLELKTSTGKYFTIDSLNYSHHA